MNKQDKIVIEQPLEGLLHDLVLLKKIELYKRTVEHDIKEIKLLTVEIDQKDGEIERLKKENEWLVAKIGHMYCKS